MEDITPKKQRLKLRERVLAYVVEHQNHGIALPIILIVLLTAALVTLTVADNRKIENYHVSVAAHEKAKDDVVRISFVGDIVLGRNVEKRAKSIGYDKLFEKMQDVWKDSDYVIANLDTCVIDGSTSDYEKLSTKDVYLCTERSNLSALKRAGIDVLSLATDHIADYGRSTIKNAVEELDSLGIKHIGAGENKEKALEYVAVEENGVKIAIFGALSYQNKEFGAKSQSILNKNDIKPGDFTWEQIQAGLDEIMPSDTVQEDPWEETAGTLYGGRENSKLIESINDIHDKFDIIVVYMHWGDDKMFYEDADMKEMAHRYIDAGADIIIGTNPRVLLPIELYESSVGKTGIIFYSIGTFVYDDAQSRVCDSVSVDLVVSADKKKYVEVTPLRINNCVPTPTDNSLYVKRIFASLTKRMDEKQYVCEDNKLIIGFEK